MNNQKLILWLCSWSLYEDQECADLILKSVSGIVIDADVRSQKFWRWMKGHFERNFEGILLLNPYYEDMLKRFPEIKTFYLDEYESNPKAHSNHQTIDESIAHLEKNDLKLIYGEPDTDNFPVLFPNEEITLSRYSDYWKFLSYRIPIPFSNQLNLWNRLEERYGGINWIDGYHTEASKFNYCWISLTKNKNDYKELIQWTSQYNKTVILFIDEGTTKKTFLALMDKFNSGNSN